MCRAHSKGIVKEVFLRKGLTSSEETVLQSLSGKEI